MTTPPLQFSHHLPPSTTPVTSRPSASSATPPSHPTPLSQQNHQQPPTSRPPPTRRDIAKTISATKNLRAISLSLVERLRVSRDGVSSTEIANQLAREAVSQVAGSHSLVAPADLLAIEKNIRRRLYDSLKVLVSVGAIRRSRKDKTLHWQGVSHLHPPPESAARPVAPLPPLDLDVVATAVAATRTRLDSKTSLIHRLAAQKLALERLCSRNKRSFPPSSSPPPRVHMPFVLVRTPHRTEINLESSPDTRSMAFRFSDNFEIINDAGILDRLFCVDSATPVTPAAPSPSLPPPLPPGKLPVTSMHIPHPPPPPPLVAGPSASSGQPPLVSVRPTRQDIPSRTTMCTPAPTTALIPPPLPPGPTNVAVQAAAVVHPTTYASSNPAPVTPRGIPSLPRPSMSSPIPTQRPPSPTVCGSRSPQPSAVHSPKRRRLSTQPHAPFAKFTSGDKPPLSPSPLRLRRRRAPTPTPPRRSPIPALQALVSSSSSPSASSPILSATTGALTPPMWPRVRRRAGRLYAPVRGADGSKMMVASPGLLHGSPRPLDASPAAAALPITPGGSPLPPPFFRESDGEGSPMFGKLRGTMRELFTSE